MEILNKNTIEKYIVPYLLKGKRGFKSKIPVTAVVCAILYRLKTGCQWRQLPLKEFFEDTSVSWNTVFYHFNRWSKTGCWERVWLNLLKAHRSELNLSSLQLDGSHTPAKNGGDATGYQGRKACKTTNALFICDNQGIMMAISTPQAGQHHDLFEIKELFGQLLKLLKEAEIDLDGLFLNADSGFDSKNLKQICDEENIIANIKTNPRNASNKNIEPHTDGDHIFDDELYKARYVIERSNAWLDAFKALLVRFEFTVRNWKALHFIAFAVLFLRKIAKKKV